MVIYVYCSSALYNHSIPIALRKIVELTIIYRNLSSLSLGTVNKATNKNTYDMMLITILINNSS